MRFPTQFDPRDRVEQNPGTGVKQMYSPKFEEDGRLTLVESGTADLYAEIQSHKDSVDLYTILKRYEAGELDVLSRVQGVYADVTGMPRTYAEMLQRIEDGKTVFAGLPKEVREEFNNDVNQFFAAMDGPDFYSRLGFKSDVEQPAEQPAQKEEVKKDE